MSFRWLGNTQLRPEVKIFWVSLRLYLLILCD
nr:MAG TPA: hypothetical protein [Caudoviricetes sp.]DAJ74650.1 MAG TPA: hypothetical protein [Caudoviricetes sp.]DAW33761.1 MAG TPA: hypothetical protein [Caudoviricetes sp.]